MAHGTSHDVPRSTTPGVDDDVLRTHLRTVLDSEEFAGSERRRNLLTYLVEETLAGRGDELKAYRIGRVALDRPSGFDPQSDPIVRVEIGRLRSTLDRFYRSHPDAIVTITIPKGRYGAEFSVTERSFRMTAAGGGVELCRLLASTDDAANVAAALTERIAHRIRDITHDPGVVTVLDPHSAPPVAETAACRVQGSVRRLDGRVRMVVEAIEPGGAGPFWTEMLEDMPADGDELGLVDRLAERVAWSLVDDWGPLAQRGVRLVDRKSSAAVRSSQLAYYQAFGYQASGTVDVRQLATASRELDAVAATAQCDARSLAALSDTTTVSWLLCVELSDEVRQHAEDLAIRAVALDPNLPEAHLALGYAHFAGGRSDLMNRAFETGLDIGTPSPTCMHHAGFMYALDGSWERAEPLMAAALDVNPELPVYWHLVPCVAAIHRGDLDQAYVESLQIGDSIGFAGAALRMATEHALGLSSAEEAKRFRSLIPEPHIQSVEDSVARVFHDPVVRRFVLDAAATAAPA